MQQISGVNQAVVFTNDELRILVLGETHSNIGLCEPCIRNCYTIEEFLMSLIHQEQAVVDMYVELVHNPGVVMHGLSISPLGAFAENHADADPRFLRLHHFDFRYQAMTGDITHEPSSKILPTAAWKAWVEATSETLNGMI